MKHKKRLKGKYGAKSDLKDASNKYMKVKVTCFWQNEEGLLTNLIQYAFGKTTWKNMQLVAGGQYDKLVILTRPHPDCMDYASEKAITFLTEPPQSSNIVEHKTSVTIPMYLPLPFWHTFKEREMAYVKNGNLPKTELLSSVTSELAYLEGHFARLKAIALLDTTLNFDLWGKKITGQFFKNLESYKGELLCKYDALWSYKYHFACENSFCNNYFTEKIADPIIAECLCFYDGCQNLEDFIDERAYIRVKVSDPVSLINTIIETIERQEWEKRVPYIKLQKKRLITQLNPLNIIWMAVNEMDVIKKCML